MRSSRGRLGSRAWIALIGAALLLSAVCPHHAATLDIAAALDVAAAAPEHAPQPCHGHGSEPAQSEEGGPALDCGCPNCGVESVVAQVAPDVAPAPTLAIAAIPDPTPTCTVPDTRGDWMPPPYPGFAENTVVLLN